MRVRPLTPQALAAEVVGRVVALPGRVRVAVDGPPAAHPEVLADALVEPLRVLGRPVARVPAAGFWRPASLRLEHGREDPDAFYEDWLDAGALAREVLDPLEAPGPAQYLPSLWDPATDRATRAPYAEAPDRLVVVVDGALLLGRWLAFDLAVHLSLSPAALARRTPSDQAWTLPAYERYAEEVLPEQLADVVVRADDPRHPALVEG